MKLLRQKSFFGKSLLLFLLLLFISLVTIVSAPANLPTAIIEPGLEQDGQHSVILMATDTETAVRLVAKAGGLLTSRLHLIDGVGATLSPNQIQWLAQQPDVTSIVHNKQVATAGDPNGNGDEDEPEEDDEDDQGYYGSNRRRTLAVHDIGSRPKIPPLLLPEGGVFVISEKGHSLILNEDGSLRASQTLPGEPFKVPALVDSSNNIYVAGENKQVHALAASGNVLWTYTDSEKIKGGLALHEYGSGPPTLYVLNEDKILTALEAATGQVRWQYQYEGDGAGNISTPPLVGTNGSVYFLTEKGHLAAVKESNQTGVLEWVYEAEGDNYKYPLLISPSDSIILTNKRKNVVSLNLDGSVQYSFSPEKDMSAPSVVGPDGSLYVVADKYLYALNPDGSLRTTFTSPHNGKFESSPAVSADGQFIYAALKERRLYALDAQSGVLLWQQNMEDDLLSSPSVESNGHIHLALKNGRYLILSPAGEALFTTFRGGELKMSPFLTRDERTALLLTEAESIEAVSLLPDTWVSGAYVLPTDDPTAWEFSTVASIDVGADVLHDDFLQENEITGNGVTIAIVDSGVAFDSALLGLAGSPIKNIFRGQADFVGNGICADDSGEYDQFATYCLMSYKVSHDPFGHGSHIAGIVWNNFTDADTDVTIGVAPGAEIFSVRVLDDEGVGSYEDIIEGLQFIVDHQDEYDIRVINLSLSAPATTPYFADPLNRAVEAAWDSGLTVVAAAGNNGDAAQSITVPGNDPYLITVGAVNTNNTPGYWADDTRPSWSSIGPTLDGFIKPDVLAPGANVISFVDGNSADGAMARMVQDYPHLAETSSLFRMSGTSTATAVTSGVVALMLEANPQLTPDQVKFRLMYTAKTAMNDVNEPHYSILQQGLGRLWAPAAVLGTLPAEAANQGLDLVTELAHPWLPGDATDPAVNPDLALHYQGPVQQIISDNGQVIMYYVPDSNTGKPVILALVAADDLSWLDPSTYPGPIKFENGYGWNSGYAWSGGTYAWSGGTYAWSGGTYAWSGGTYAWSGGTYAWSGGTYAWSGGTYAWSGGEWTAVIPQTAHLGAGMIFTE